MLAAEREGTNWRFRSFLKRVDLELEELDAIVYRHYEAVSKQIDCTSCYNCCCEVIPSLDQDDVGRLASGLGFSTEDLTKRLLAPDEDGDLSFNKKPCPLLTENLCRAYGHRPKACRSFPHLDKGEFGFRLGRAVHNCSICPIVFNVYERLKNEPWSTHDEGFREEWE